LLRQWLRGLRARSRSVRTIETYTETAEPLAAFARSHGHEVLGQELIEDLSVDQVDRWKPSTVAFPYRSLQQLHEVAGGRRPSCSIESPSSLGR
jgi:hypothetical protein